MKGYRFVDRLNENQTRDLWQFYQEEWWTRGRRLEDIENMLGHSDLIFALVEEASDRLAGFSRVLTDYVYKALVLDVIVGRDFRNNGLGVVLMEKILSHPDLKEVRNFELYCRAEMVPYYQKWKFKADLGDLQLMRLDRIT